MIFVFDLDDTVCETDKYSEKYILNFIKKNNLLYKQIATSVRFAERKFDWSPETALTWYKTYGDEMMLNFPCKKNAVNIINNLFDNGHKIIIATARATDWHVNPELITKLWLEKTGIKYNKLYIGRIDKEKICEDEHADIFVDDDLNITKKVNEYFLSTKNENKKCLLMTTLYNKNLQEEHGVVRIENFNDLKENVDNLVKLK